MRLVVILSAAIFCGIPTVSTAIDIGEIDLSRPFPLSRIEYRSMESYYNPWSILDVDNIQINSDGSGEVQNEEMVCVNPVNPANAVAVWRDFRLGFRRVGVGYTFDGGQTWHDTLLYVPPHPKQSDPVLVVDNEGNYFACTLCLQESIYEPSGIYVQKSTDGGVNWGDPVMVVDSMQAYFEDKQWIAIDRTGNESYGNIYIPWTRFSSDLSTSRIVICSSRDQGLTYSGAVNVSDDTRVQWSTAAVGIFGELYVAWVDFRHQAINLDISIDEGRSFGTDLLIADLNTLSAYINGQITVFPYPAMATDVSQSSPYYGNLYIAFMDDAGPDMDIFFIKSTNGGSSWTNRSRINDDPGQNGADQFHPWISVDENGAIHAIFYDRRLDTNNFLFDLFYTRSDDGGETWSPNERITSVSSSPGDARLGGLIGEYIGLDARQGQVQMVWTDTRNGNQDVFSGRITPTGVSDGNRSIPDKFRLASPYPNPFNSSMAVSFFSAEESPVTLEIVDILGRKQATIFEGVCGTGLSRYTWDGTDTAGKPAASGVYFIRLSGPDRSLTKKAVLLR